MIKKIRKLLDDVSNLKDVVNAIENKDILIENRLLDLETENRIAKKVMLSLHRSVTESEMLLPQIVSEDYSLDRCYEKLKALASKSFEIYIKLSKNGDESYQDGTALDSCTVDGHEVGGDFKFFLSRYLKGYVLDIGCGPQEIPLYLEDYDYEYIYGLDPISPVRRHPFTFVQGISEFIPWCDNCFNCVIFATSFDHIFLVDKVLAEVSRVIAKKGHLVIWTSFDEKAADYDPFSEDFMPYDKYHMFHSRKISFEKLFEDEYELVEYFKASNNNHFYSFRKK